MLGVGAGTANADPTDPPTSIPAPAGPGTTDAEVADDLPNPEESNRRDLRDRALQEVLSGKRKVQERNGSDVVRLGTKQATLNQSELSQVSRGRAVTPRTVDQYVEMSRERTDKIFVVLVEFGDERATDIDPRYGDRDTDPGTPGPVTFDGPRHNAIPEPDRRRDNTTIWRPDYDADHYRQLYFGAGSQSLKTYYERQSSGRYSLDGAGVRLGQGAVQRGEVRAQQRLPLCRQRVRQLLVPGAGRHRGLGEPSRRPPAGPTPRSRRP